MRWGQKREKWEKNSFPRSRARLVLRLVAVDAWAQSGAAHTGCGNSAASSMAPHSSLARGLRGKREKRQQAQPTNGESRTGPNRKHGRSDPSCPLTYQILAVKT